LTRRTITPTLLGAFLALSIIGGFLALDRTALHWYASEDEHTVLATLATPQPVYSTRDVLALTLTQFSHSPVPSSMHSLHCYDAHFVSQNQTWVVRCGYWVTKPAFPTPGVPDHAPDFPQTFSFDDQTGAVK
jgi:hypothetical protein